MSSGDSFEGCDAKCLQTLFYIRAESALNHSKNTSITSEYVTVL